MFRIVFVLSLFSFSAIADGIWGDWSAWGNGCNSNSTRVLTNGQTISVLFDGYQLDLREGERRERLNNVHCLFKVEVTPPPGMELAGFSQTYSGGIIKSAGAAAKLTINYQFGHFLKTKEINWNFGQKISPEDSRSVFATTYNDNFNLRGCGQKVTYHIRMLLLAGRRSDRDFLVGGMDSLDATVNTHLKMSPQWRACRR